jgi:hypothetical protein
MSWRSRRNIAADADTAAIAAGAADDYPANSSVPRAHAMTWNTVEDIAFKNVSSTQGPFVLRGGSYGVTVHAGSWGGGSATLQRLGDDGATYVTVLTAFAADGYAGVNLPSGTYQLAIATATGVYADIVGIVTTQ